MLVPLGLALVVAVSACGGGSSGGTTPAAGNTSSASTPAATSTAPADPAAAKAQIIKNWEAFFSSKTPSSQAAALLENGSQLGPALAKAKAEDRATGGHRSAKVTKVSFTSTTQATVNYKLHVGTTKLNSAGVAVLQGGQWKVSETTFCTLVELGNNEKPVKSCPK
jgi:hypothetical protein